MMNRTLSRWLAALALAPAAVLAQSQPQAQPRAPSSTASPTASSVQVDGAWIRPSVAGQSGTGGFMRLVAREPMTLVGVSSPVAGTAEVHEMRMDGDVMRMRAIPALDLPAGQAVELRPGGHHLMLMNLRMPLKVDTQVPLTLVLRDARGAEQRVQLQVPVALRAPGAVAAAASAAPSPSQPAPHAHSSSHRH